MEKVINQPKRFVPITRYCETSGLSYQTVNHMLNSGQLPYITTESGQRRIDTQPADAGQGVVMAELHEHRQILKALVQHFNVPVDRRCKAND